jgi:hypothetical protein
MAVITVAMAVITVAMAVITVVVSARVVGCSMVGTTEQQWQPH